MTVPRIGWLQVKHYMIRSAPKTHAERRRPKDGKSDEHDHPYIFFFHNIPPCCVYWLVFFYHDIEFLVGPLDLDLGGGGHLCLEAQGPHHHDTDDPEGDLPGPQRWKSGK